MKNEKKMDQIKHKDGLGIDIIGFEYLFLVHVVESR